MSTTAGNIITASFLKIGVDSPTAAQTASALISLNNMISMWGGEGLIYCVTSESFAVAVNDPEYTIGSGGQWDTARPISVKNCYLRDSDNYDFDVNVMSSKDYYRQTNKSFVARPTKLYWLPEYPLGKIIFNTYPDYAYSAYFEFLKSFTEFATTSTAVTLPNEYKEALVYNLTVSLGEDWDRPVSKTILVKADQYKGNIESLIASLKVVPNAVFDVSRISRERAYDGYNIVTDGLIDGGS